MLDLRSRNDSHDGIDFCPKFILENAQHISLYSLNIERIDETGVFTYLGLQISKTTGLLVIHPQQPVNEKELLTHAVFGVLPGFKPFVRLLALSNNFKLVDDRIFELMIDQRIFPDDVWIFYLLICQSLSGKLTSILIVCRLIVVAIIPYKMEGCKYVHNQGFWHKCQTLP